MKKLIRVLTVVLALTLLAGCSLVEIDTTKIVVAKVGDQTISKADFDTGLNAYLSSYGYTADSAEIADQIAELKTNYLESMIQELVVKAKAVELGYDQLTQEEKDEVWKEANDWYDEQYAALLETHKDDEDPAAAAQAAIQSSLESAGYASLEDLVNATLETKPTNKLYTEMTKDVTVTDEEVKTSYDENVASDATKYAEDLTTFYNDYMNGMTIYNNPEGFFFVKHIFLKFTDEQVEEITTLRAEGDDAAAEAKILEAAAEKDALAQEVLAKVEAGEDFDALVAQYGEDPGMQSEPRITDGYLTYVDNAGMYAQFTAATNELKATGDTSGLVNSDHGIHIIRRVGDLKAGPVEFDSVKDLLKAKLLSSKQSTTYQELIEQWMQEMAVSRFENQL